MRSIDAAVLDDASAYLLRCWRERARELHAATPPPSDLTGACKFAAVFAQTLFGGEVRGNWYHLFCVQENGQRIDLTNNVQFAGGIPLGLENRARQLGLHVRDIYEHDPRLFRETEFLAALASTRERVRDWARAYEKEKTS